jgi:hypothetical protein
MTVSALRIGADGGGVGGRFLVTADLVCKVRSTSLFDNLAGGGEGGGGLVSAATLDGRRDLPRAVSLSEGEGEVALSHARLLATLDGETPPLPMGLIDLGGVISLGFVLPRRGISSIDGEVPFLTGSVSSSLFSNIDIRAFAEGIGVVSVARSRLVRELAALGPAPLPLGAFRAVCCP